MPETRNCDRQRSGGMARCPFPMMGLGFLSFVISISAASAQSAPREGKDAFGSWQQDAPGTVRLIRPQDLPAPGATASAANVSRVVPKPAEAALRVPAGFKIDLFAEGLSGPRIIRGAPNGDIFVAE